MRKLILARNSQMLTDFYRAMLARDMLWQIPLSVRQSVWLSVRLSQADMVSEWLNLWSRKQFAGTLSSFTMPEISAELRCGHPKRGRQLQVGGLKSAIGHSYYERLIGS